MPQNRRIQFSVLFRFKNWSRANFSKSPIFPIWFWFSKIMKILSREKIIFHMLFGASHGTPRIWFIQYNLYCIAWLGNNWLCRFNRSGIPNIWHHPGFIFSFSSTLLDDNLRTFLFCELTNISLIWTNRCLNYVWLCWKCYVDVTIEQQFCQEVLYHGYN